MLSRVVDEESQRLIELGHELSKRGKLVSAECAFRRALVLKPSMPMAHNNLGWVRQKLGDSEEAIRCYLQALKLDPSLVLARINLALCLTSLERLEESKPIWRSLISDHPQKRSVLERAITDALSSGNLGVASACAREYAVLTRASRWYPRDGSVRIPIAPFPERPLTYETLQHDAEQLQYLHERRLLPNGIAHAIEVYQEILADNMGANEPQLRLTERGRKAVAEIYGRIVHIRNAPRVAVALSRVWDPVAIEREYIRGNGVVVIDDFLSNEALRQLRLFCLESTVWLTNRYAYGRLGAFFREGFNCPLLVQIAEELRHSFGQIIGDRHPLRQLWAFKYNYSQPQLFAHADFAAVNVNLWLTPDEANSDTSSGGLIIYDLEAPLSWDFDAYNKDGSRIDAFLREKQANSINIPYRANRAVIFNSDLFHTTGPLNFRLGYENRRLNVTMLYGTRDVG